MTQDSNRGRSARRGTPPPATRRRPASSSASSGSSGYDADGSLGIYPFGTAEVTCDSGSSSPASDCDSGSSSSSYDSGSSSGDCGNY